MTTEQKRIAPYQEQGRWYKVFLEKDGDNIKYTSGDIGSQSSILNNNFCVSHPFHVLDVHYDIHLEELSSDVWFEERKRLYGNGIMGIELPAIAHWDYMTLYIFGYYDEIE